MTEFDEEEEEEEFFDLKRLVLNTFEEGIVDGAAPPAFVCVRLECYLLYSHF